MLFEKKFIIESEPERTLVSDYLLRQTAQHINNGYKDGLTIEEIHILLNWTVENTRQNIEKYTGKNIKNDDLMGLCGFCRTSSLLPFKKIFKETYNSTTDFPYVSEELRHAFGTIAFPLKTENEIEEKKYLIDITYRQFFKKIMCETKYKNDGTTEVDPGYFLCSKKRKTIKSLEFSKQLLKKGYIELTNENLMLYINSFILSSIFRTNLQLIGIINKLEIDFYNEHIKKIGSFEQEFDEEDLLKIGCITKMPYIKYKQMY